jgi:glycine cleavage system H protein
VEFPEDLRYARSHEWVRLEEGGEVVMGISDFAQDALGDVVYVDLPEVGRTLEAGVAVAEIESTKSVNDIYAPIAGTVVAVNEALFDAPEAVNTDPYGAGWLVRIAPAGDVDLTALLEAAAYRSLTEQED